jgi:MarR family transcriptional regulator, organic hydroperoxide resistance regulator
MNRKCISNEYGRESGVAACEGRPNYSLVDGSGNGRSPTSPTIVATTVVLTSVFGGGIISCMPASSPPPAPRRFDSLEQQVYLNLWRTYDRLREIEERLFLPHGLSAQQYNALRLLKRAAPDSMTVRELGSRLISRAADVTRMLDRLEANGWVARVRPPENRRVVEVRVLEAGLKLLETLAAPVIEMHQVQLGHLTRQELQQLKELLAMARDPHEAPWSEWRVSGSPTTLPAGAFVGDGDAP